MKKKIKCILKHTVEFIGAFPTRKTASLLLVLFIGSTLTWAQTGSITVKGTVLDDFGDPLIGASVSEQGSTNGTMSDVDGKYTITLPSNANIVATFIGFHTQTIKVNGRTTLDIRLVEDSKVLDEVVVTALGIKRETKALGYAVAEVKGDDITKGRDNNAITALSGRMAGVDISGGAGGPMGSTRVVIRGQSKLSGSNQPLYVVDGVPMDNSSLGSADTNGGYDLGDGLASINPMDIESVSVLKGASSAALYGSRASNGVVLITTKSGKGQQGLGIDFSSSINAVSIVDAFDDYQRVYGQGTGGQIPLNQTHSRTSTQSAWGAKLNPNLMYEIYNGEVKPYGNVNHNILDFFRTGSTFTNNLAISSNSDKTHLRVSVSDMRNKDIVPSSSMNRTTFMIRGGAQLGDKLTLEARANYTKEGTNNRPALSDSPNNIGNSIIGIAPSFDQKWLANGYKDELGRYNSWNANEWRLNPYWVLNEMSNKSEKDRLMGHLQLNYQILPFLSVQAKAGTDWNRFRFTDFIPMHTDGIQDGRMTLTTSNIQETNYEGLILYNQKFLSDALDVSAMFGGNIMQYRNLFETNVGHKQLIPGIQSIKNYNRKELEVADIRKQVNSLFGSIGLGYKNFLYADFTFRNDISSTLNKDNNSYFYPGISGSFVFSEIVDLSKYKLSFGKVRASWAKVGGDTEPYKLYNSYNLLQFAVGGYPLGQLASTHVMPNYDLMPESKYSYEVGLDLRFFQDRLGIDVNYFSSSTKDQIMDIPISSTSGYKKAAVNAGEIQEKGIEIAINAVPVRTRDFEWSTNFNLTKISNKIKSLYEDLQYYQQSSARWAGAYIGAKVGENYGSIIGNRIARNEDGRVILNNQGMPTYDSEVSILGNGNHDFNLGFGNNFRYRDFTLGVLLDMKFGADIYSMSARGSHDNGTSKNTLPGREGWYRSEEARRAANASEKDWLPTDGLLVDGVIWNKDTESWDENTKYVNPQYYWQALASNSPEPFIQDASYIKLREISFSYTLPKKLLASTFLKEVSFTAYGRNLWIIHSKLKNIDPESSYNTGNAQGFEYGSIPSRRTYGFGVNVKF